LKYLPKEITPIIVENNGQQETYLDYFHHFSTPVKVIYTQNNVETYKNKGVNELLDIKEVIQCMCIQDTDIIIKLTGRYRALSPLFFNTIVVVGKSVPATLVRDNDDLFAFRLGCFAITVPVMVICLFGVSGSLLTMVIVSVYVPVANAFHAENVKLNDKLVPGFIVTVGVMSE
jgi:hypothetical protein